MAATCVFLPLPKNEPEGTRAHSPIRPIPPPVSGGQRERDCLLPFFCGKERENGNDRGGSMNKSATIITSIGLFVAPGMAPQIRAQAQQGGGRRPGPHVRGDRLRRLNWASLCTRRATRIRGSGPRTKASVLNPPNSTRSLTRPQPRHVRRRPKQQKEGGEWRRGRGGRRGSNRRHRRRRREGGGHLGHSRRCERPASAEEGQQAG